MRFEIAGKLIYLRKFKRELHATHGTANINSRDYCLDLDLDSEIQRNDGYV